ncbi:TetR/AcrR family transcriptional regulator [Agrilactobacillus fermenti]|uniref:TetR/AcrR family transcriptional regulator n=1 Tax=Agrilactobacillus fermenti TaxID=2586909 RepID=UPI001E50C5CC|nr:TetR/AcrR family transcriptional regulator [Agrilactobacillus fermenti]MCD2256879.1 TetR/AcrR family transcriptional regulator [Agrilactobacillus fermenti]
MHTELTRNYVIRTLGDYLSEQRVKKLTVQELLVITGVSRSTFYRHFNNGLQDIFFAVVEERLLLKLRQCSSWMLALDLLVEELVAQRILFLNLYQNSNVMRQEYFLQETFECFISQYFKPQYFARINASYMTFFTDGLRLKIREWLTNNLNIEPKQMRAQLDALSLLLIDNKFKLG